jgi:hypothetical protein
MSKEFSHRQKFIESCNSLILELDNQDLNENIFKIVNDYVGKLYDNIKTPKEIADFYIKLLTNNKALQTYLDKLVIVTKKNIGEINNNYFNKLLNKLNNTPTLKNLLYISALICATEYYIKFSANIPDLVVWGDTLLQSQLINNNGIGNIDSIIQFLEMLIKIVGSIFFIYDVLIAPYKNEILSIVGNFNLLKTESLTESKFTNYNKRNMKKVLITESQLRGMVRKMLNEMDGMGIGTSGFIKPTVDTSQEVTFEKGLEKQTALNTILKNVTQPYQLNGIFKDIIEATNITTNKSRMIDAITTAFNEIDTKDGKRDGRIQSPQKSFQQKANMQESRQRRRF